MDAKPQRIRVRGDENAPPLQQNKSIHQRNKSTSALNAPSARNTTRRAFGDLSNTTDQRTFRDDADVAEKPTLQPTEKPALSQPAQRPTSVSGIKGLLNNVTTKPVNPAGKANIVKTAKRNNAVFRDSENLEPVIEKEAPKEPASSVLCREPAVEEQMKSKIIEKNAKDTVSVIGEKEAQIGASVDSKDRVSIIDKLEIDEVDDAPAASVRTSIPNLSESEEYWDEDESHHQLARSDNTTGGLTTNVFPKFSDQTRYEILQAKKIVEASRTEEDIMEDFFDTTMVAEYTNEIFLFMRQKEIAMLPITDYMDNQAEIQWSMRAVLMDWLVQVHFRFNLLPETLYLCVNYIDRFLSNKIVSLGKLQLVGATALYIAAKYEEVTPPSVHDIVYMVDGGYSVEEIFKAERFMLGILSFELGWPGPMSFLRRISKADDYDLETRTVAKYFIELTIMDERFVCTPPSFAAAAAHCLALLMLRKGVWTAAHAYYSGYVYRQLFDTLVSLVDCCESPQTHHQAIFDKYMDRRFKRASGFVESEMQRGFSVPLPAKDDNEGRYNGTANY